MAKAPRRGALNPSGSSESDRDFLPLQDHRHLPAAGELNHALELIGVRLDVDVVEGNLASRVVLTGRGCVGSGVLAEDLDGLSFHRFPPPRS